MTKAPRPENAVAVILLRSTESGRLEVFLTRHSDDTPALGSAVAFPCDKVKRDDYSAAMLRRCRGLSPAAARDIIGARFPPRAALGSWVAGIRTLFRDVGVLLAVNEARQDVLLDPERKAGIRERHAALLTQSLSFQSLLEKEELWADASKLVYFSSWQTVSPSGMPLDTRFYLAALPRGQNPMPTLPHVGTGFWISPDRALRLCDRRELPMAFSTFASLRTLGDFDSAASVLKEYGSVRGGES